MVYRTLVRIAEGDEDIQASTRGGVGRPRTLSEADDLYIGLLLCDGYSQRPAERTEMVNAES